MGLDTGLMQQERMQMKDSRASYLKKLKGLPPGERPREKMLAEGAGALSDAELIALIISSGTADKSALELAAELLSLEPAGLSAFLRYQPEEFCRVRGIGSAKASQIMAAIELGRRVSRAPSEKRVKLDRPGAVAELFMDELRVLPKEIFRVVMVNVKNQLIASEDISVGGLSSSMSHPREVFSSAVRRSAYAVILIHNHPSGDPTPSDADISVTRQLSEAGRVLGIPVLDHVLIGDGCWRSMKEEGLLV